MFPFCREQTAIKGTKLSTPISDDLKRSRLLLSADLVKPPRSCQDTAAACPSPTQCCRNARGSRQLPKEQQAAGPSPPLLRTGPVLLHKLHLLPSTGARSLPLGSTAAPPGLRGPIPLPPSRLVLPTASCWAEI